MKSTTRSLILASLAVVAAIALLFFTMTSCSGQDNRHPTAAQGKAADVKRQKYIDNLKLPENVKEQMKAHLGGPPAPAQGQAEQGGPVGPATGKGAKR